MEGEGTAGCGQQARAAEATLLHGPRFPAENAGGGTLASVQTFCLPCPCFPDSPLPALVAQQYLSRVFPLPAPPFPGYDPLPRFAGHPVARRGGGDAHARRESARAERAARGLRVREGRPGGWRALGVAAPGGAGGGLVEGLGVPGHARIRGWNQGRGGQACWAGGRGRRTGPGPAGARPRFVTNSG